MVDQELEAGTIALSFAGLSQVGGRELNQDAFGNSQQDDLACFVVSDGAGGHEGGEVASKTVVSAILQSFNRESSFGVRAMRSYVEHAIAQVAQRKEDNSRLKDMSATVAVVLIDQENRAAIWAHLGDTRIYFFRRSKILKMSRDHSLVQQFVDAGYCKADQLRSHPQRSSLFAAIGSENNTPPDVTEPACAIQDGDAFLICTDGFWEWITEDQMESTLALAETVEAWLEEMNRIVDRSPSQSRDNCTAFAVWLGQPEVVTIIQ